MNSKKLLKLVKYWLFYDPETGLFEWKETKGPRAIKGNIAGGIHHSGYVVIQIEGRFYQAHRLAFLIHYGFLVEMIDHINQVKTDNRIKNLRPCTASQNQWNRGYGKKNKSGFIGVGFHKKSNLWQARISTNHKRISLGYYKTKEEAAEAYDDAALKYHKSFAVFNFKERTGEIDGTDK